MQALLFLLLLNVCVNSYAVKMFLSSRQDGWSSRLTRGARGMLPRKILKISASNGCILCSLEVNSDPIR